jgi:hypothetical protein
MDKDIQAAVLNQAYILSSPPNFNQQSFNINILTSVPHLPISSQAPAMYCSIISNLVRKAFSQLYKAYKTIFKMCVTKQITLSCGHKVDRLDECEFFGNHGRVFTNLFSNHGCVFTSVDQVLEEKYPACLRFIQREQELQKEEKRRAKKGLSSADAGFVSFPPLS